MIGQSAQPIRAPEIKPNILKADLRADQKVDQVVETVEIKSSADAENVLNSTLANIEKEMIIMCEVEIQVDVKDFVDRDELDGLGPFEFHFPMSLTATGQSIYNSERFRLNFCRESVT